MTPYNNEKGIISLVAILTIGLFALGLLTISVVGALKESAKNQNSEKGLQSFYSAESAASEAAYQFHNDTSYTGSTVSLINGSTSGSITVDTTTLSWPYLYVIGEADNTTNHREVVYKLVHPEGQAFEYAIYSEDTISLSGNASVYDGNVFANNDVDISGSASINNGEVVSSDSYIPAPEIDLAPYKSVAELSGKYFDSSDDAEDYINSKINATYIYIEDDDGDLTKLQGANTSLSGFLVVDGDLQISGGTYTATGNNAAIVVEGDLQISGGTVINGVVYVKGSTTFGSGNNVINGSLISVGATSIADISGNSKIYYNPPPAGVLEILTGLVPQKPIIDGWEEK